MAHKQKKLPLLALIALTAMASAGLAIMFYEYGFDRNLGTSAANLAKEEASAANLAEGEARPLTEAESRSWYFITNSVPFGVRDHGSLAFHQGALYLNSGFFNGRSTYQDLWWSVDFGVNWQLVHGFVKPVKNSYPGSFPIVYPMDTVPAPMSKIISFKDKLWALGTHLWHSYDGAVFYKVKELNRSFSGDTWLVEFDGDLLAIDTSQNSVWNISRDEPSSHLIHPQFVEKSGGSAFVHNGEIFIVGGSNNQLWTSKDGTNWSRSLETSGFSVFANRWWPCVTTDPLGRIWVVGGYDPVSGNNLGDVWYTDDLITWHLYAEDLINLHASACAFDEKNLQIVIVGGKGGVDARNDRGAVTNHVIGLPVTIELLDVAEN